MKTKYLIMISEIIDKMGIKNELKSLEINTGNTERDNEELGKEIIALLITRIYKCETEVYTFIADYKGYLPDKDNYEASMEIDPAIELTKDQLKDIEKKQKELDYQYKKDLKEALKRAKDEDVIAIFKEVSKLEGVKNFLA